MKLSGPAIRQPASRDQSVCSQVRGLGEFPEKAKATECLGSLLEQLGLDMGLEGWRGFDGLEGGGAH